jgi:hypothetical protein
MKQLLWTVLIGAIGAAMVASAPVQDEDLKLTGTVQMEAGKYFLVEKEDSRIALPALKGGSWDTYVGKKVAITGKGTRKDNRIELKEVT